MERNWTQFLYYPSFPFPEKSPFQLDKIKRNQISIESFQLLESFQLNAYQLLTKLITNFLFFKLNNFLYYQFSLFKLQRSKK